MRGVDGRFFFQRLHVNCQWGRQQSVSHESWRHMQNAACNGKHIRFRNLRETILKSSYESAVKDFTSLSFNEKRRD